MGKVVDDVRVAQDDCELGLVIEHPVTTLLRQLANALEDLKRGKVHLELKPTNGVGGAAHRTQDKERILTLLALSKTLRETKGISKVEADKIIAKKYGDFFLVNRKPVTATLLESWRKRWPFEKGHSQ